MSVTPASSAAWIVAIERRSSGRPSIDIGMPPRPIALTATPPMCRVCIRTSLWSVVVPAPPTPSALGRIGAYRGVGQRGADQVGGQDADQGRGHGLHDGPFGSVVTRSTLRRAS